MPLPRQPSTKRGRNASIASSLRLRLIARRSPSASPIEKPAAAIATSSTWSWKTTTPSVSRSASRSDSCSTGGSNARIVAHSPGGARCTGAPPCPGSARGGRARPAPSGRRGSPAASAAGSASARGSRSGRRRRCPPPGSPRRRRDRRAGCARGRSSRRAAARSGRSLLDRREHPEPEQVDLQEAGVAAAVLVPLADLAAGHRRGLHRDEVDQRPRRDDHAARVLADVARQPGDLARQLAERVPARAGMRARHAVELVARPAPRPSRR